MDGLDMIVVSRQTQVRIPKNSLRAAEDFIHIDEKNRLFVVADGMGGNSGGDWASRIAVNAFTYSMTGLMQSIALSQISKEDIGKYLSREISGINKNIMHPISRYSSGQLQGFGTTIAILYIHDNIGYVANVGDSRIYHIRDNKITLLTEDDRLASDSTKRSSSWMPGRKINPLSKGLGQFLGKENIDPHQAEQQIIEEDIFLLCSDGLSDYVSDREIAASVSGTYTADAADKLLNLAQARANSRKKYCEGIEISCIEPGDSQMPDDIALILVKYLRGDDKHEYC